MLFQPNDSPPDIRAGIWKHYKGDLYQVIGYSHNATNGLANRVEVDYIGLQLDSRKPGPRPAHREWREFFATVCTVHSDRTGGALEVYDPKHEEIVRDERRTLDAPLCDPEKNWVERFTYMGPYYLAGFERKTAWQEEQQ